MRVGFVGLGLMGEPMAARLIAAGHELTVNSRRRSSAVRLESLGAVWADTPARCATGRDAVVLMLPDVATVDSVALGPDGVVTAADAAPLIVDMSTTDPRLAERIAGRCAERGIAALDAPVTGGPPAAANGTLRIMVGGPADAFTRAEPVLSALGTPHLIGGTGAGQRTKLVNQLLIAGAASGIAEAWTLARRLGLDPAAVHGVVGGGMGGGALLSFMWPRLVAGDFAPGFKIDQMVKDLCLALAEAQRLGIDLPAAGNVLARYRELSERGHGDLGTQALVHHESLRTEPDDERN